jgi:hypothetical protein
MFLEIFSEFLVGRGMDVFKFGFVGVLEFLENL